MGRLKALGSRLGGMPAKVKAAPKVAEGFYSSPAWRGLNAAAQGVNVAAEKELMKRLDKAALADLSERVANRDHVPSKVKTEKIGKKAAAKDAAGQVGGKFAPPPAPRLIN